MSRRLRIGWIGAFKEAREQYLPSMTDWEDMELVSLCHPDEERLQQAAANLGIRKTFVQPGSMLRSVEMEAVFVTMPADKALPVLEACVARRLHVCTTAASLPELAALRKLNRTAAESGVRVNVLFPRRHAPLLGEIKKEMETTGRTLTHLAVTLHAPPGMLSPEENLRSDRVEWLSGVDLLRYLGGEIASLSGLVGRYDLNNQPSALTALVHFSEGATGVLLSDRAAGTRREFVEIHALSYTASFDYQAEAQICTSGSTQPIRHLRNLETDDGPAPMRITGGYDAACRKFIDALLRDQPLPTELDHAISSLELLRRLEGNFTDDENE